MEYKTRLEKHVTNWRALTQPPSGLANARNKARAHVDEKVQMQAKLSPMRYHPLPMTNGRSSCYKVALWLPTTQKHGSINLHMLIDDIRLIDFRVIVVLEVRLIKVH